MQVIYFLSFISFLSLALVTPTSSLLAPRTITAYSIHNFSRDYTNSHVCIYNLTIDTGESETVCTVVDETPIINRRYERTGPLATTHAFYGKPCLEDNRWELSWRWYYQGDFTVLTVKHVPNSKQAYL